MRNCPFYGQHFAFPFVTALPFLLLDSQGNECALVIGAYAPCSQPDDQIDWKVCPRVREIRSEGRSTSLEP